MSFGFDFDDLGEAEADSVVHMPEEETGGGGSKETLLFSNKDAAEWRSWKKWVEAHIADLEEHGKLKPKALGPMLYKMLRGDAKLPFEDVWISTLRVEGGEKIIFKPFDTMYPEVREEEKMVESHDQFFDLETGPAPGETTVDFSAKFKTRYTRMSRYQTDINPKTLGYLTMRWMGVSIQQRSNVFTKAQSMELDKVSEALGYLYPQGLKGGNEKAYGKKPASANAVDLDELIGAVGVGVADTVRDSGGASSSSSSSAGGYTAPSSSPPSEREQILEDALASMEEDSLTSHVDETKEYEEPETKEILANYIQRRDMINQARKARGFPPLSGPPPPAISKLLERTKCFLCKKLGHMKRNCPTLNKKTKSNMFVTTQAPFFGLITCMLFPFDAALEVRSSFNQQINTFRDAVNHIHHGSEVCYGIYSVPDVYDIPTVSTRKANALTALLNRTVFGSNASVFDIHFSQIVGYGIVDTGCARCAGGETALNAHVQYLRSLGYSVREEPSEIRFRFGNGTVNRALGKVYVPVAIGTRSALLVIHKVPGDGPILLSNSVLRAISHGIEYDSNELRLRLGGRAKFSVTGSGHLVLNLTPPPKEQWNSDTRKVIEHDEVSVYALYDHTEENDLDVFEDPISYDLAKDGQVGGGEASLAADEETPDSDECPLQGAGDEAECPETANALATEGREEESGSEPSPVGDSSDEGGENWVERLKDVVQDSSSDTSSESGESNDSELDDLLCQVCPRDKAAEPCEKLYYGSFHVDLGIEMQVGEEAKTTEKELAELNLETDLFRSPTQEDWEEVPDGSRPLFVIDHKEPRRTLLSRHDLPENWWPEKRDEPIEGRISVLEYVGESLDDRFKDTGESNEDVMKAWTGKTILFGREQEQQKPADPSRALAVCADAPVKALSSWYRSRYPRTLPIEHELWGLSRQSHGSTCDRTADHEFQLSPSDDGPHLEPDPGESHRLRSRAS